MKITRSQLKKIIKEELSTYQEGGGLGPGHLDGLGWDGHDVESAEMRDENALGAAIEVALKLAVKAARTDVEDILVAAHETLMRI